MEVPQGYKQTSIGIIPEDWEEMELGKIGKFFKGRGVPKDKIVKEGFKCLTYGDLYTKYDILIKDVKSHITQETAEISQQIEFGDICIAGSGETIEDIGKCATFVADEIGYAGGDIIVFRSDNNAVTLSYILNSDTAKRQKYKFGQGHSVVHIYSSQLEKLKIPLPPLPEQQKIAEILSTWDKAIETCQKTIEVLKQRNKGLAQQLLSGKTKVKGFEKTEWKAVKLGEIGKITSNGVDKKIIEGEIPVRLLNYLDVYRRNYLFSNEISHTVTTTQQKVLTCDVKKGDVFFTPSSEVRNDIAVSAVAMEDFENTVYSYHVVRLRFNQEMDLQFKAHIFKTDLFFRQAQRICEGSGTRYVVSQEYFRNISISIPELEEQKQIGNILCNADKEIKHYEEKLANLKLQKKGLMQQLLTGKVRVRI
ncbi:restriction endonuclease subunit S [Cruoricaptor ignavus]|uniref:Restriction endonuclease subunit S n=1 Tax=Cruoricaptor ignavus TaxID=1118202 RepID=A0A7M1T2H2_9FLAO|nr:restriction endonuclease subunit S [Cruoricaptor ignavus]QOR74058.1 restriction endonuclease subunit S [Cruoricaptor ignavus]